MIFRDKINSILELRIIELLYYAENHELSITQIMQALKMNHGTVHKILLELVGKDFLQEKLFSRIRIYRLKKENNVISCFFDLFEKLHILYGGEQIDEK